MSYPKLLVIDETECAPENRTKEAAPARLSEEFGRNLETIERAREWLTNPNNWHISNLYILKWDGLLCTVSRYHGERLLREPWDNGLPWAAVYEQKRLRSRASGSDGSSEEPELPSDPDMY